MTPDLLHYGMDSLYNEYQQFNHSNPQAVIAVLMGCHEDNACAPTMPVVMMHGNAHTMYHSIYEVIISQTPMADVIMRAMISAMTLPHYQERFSEMLKSLEEEGIDPQNN